MVVRIVWLVLCPGTSLSLEKLHDCGGTCGNLMNKKVIAALLLSIKGNNNVTCKAHSIY